MNQEGNKIIKYAIRTIRMFGYLERVRYFTTPNKLSIFIEAIGTELFSVYCMLGKGEYAGVHHEIRPLPRVFLGSPRYNHS